MEIKNYVVLGIALSAMAIRDCISISANDAVAGETDGITDDSLLVLPTTETPLAHTDNGITLGEYTDQVTTGNFVHGYEASEETGHIEKPTTSLLAAEIPDNHKNYTGNPFVNSIELPPLLNQFNTYQEQYKTYYNQKNEYELKPVKFELNSAKNHYVTQSLKPYLDETDARHRYEELKFSREPFPYAYESERIPFISQSTWSEYSDPIRNEIGYEAYKQDKPEIPSKEGFKDLYVWKKALKFFTVLVPLGLLLATFTPSVISINSTDQKLTKQRSLNERLNLTAVDLGEYMKRIPGVNASDNRECKMAEICKLSRLGKEASSEDVLKNYWYLANETPDDIAEELGLKDLFQAIRNDKCDSYKCQKRRKIMKKTKQNVFHWLKGKRINR